MMDAFRRWCESILRIPPDPEAPPGDESTARVFRATPAYFRLLFIKWALSNVFLIFVFFASFGISAIVALINLQRQPGAGVAVAIIGVFLSLVTLLFLFQALFRLAVMRLEYEKRWYVVTDRSLRVREGVVIVREMTVSFANIQDVAVTQGPIERILKLSNVRVTTAGGGGHAQGKQPGQNLHQAWFRGIDNAEEVRSLILQRLRALKDSGLGDKEEQMLHEPAPSNESVLDALRSVLTEARSLRAVVEKPATTS